MGIVLGIVIGFALVAVFLGTGPRRDCPHCRSRYRVGATICPRCQRDLPQPPRTPQREPTDWARRDREQLRAVANFFCPRPRGHGGAKPLRPPEPSGRGLARWFRNLTPEGKVITTVSAAGALAIAVAAPILIAVSPPDPPPVAEPTPRLTYNYNLPPSSPAAIAGRASDPDPTPVPSRTVRTSTATPVAVPAPAPAWYEGGTLHDKTMADWRRASYRNRLATCADFVAALAESSGRRFDSIDQIKPYAVRLERCLSEAARGGHADGQTITSMAAACSLLMNEP